MKNYYECHVTMTGDQEILRNAVAQIPGWRFSAIDGDANLGPGVKCYATLQMNTRIGEETAVGRCAEAAARLRRAGAEILRRKVELVVWDDRSALVRNTCGGGCPECVGESAGGLELTDELLEEWRREAHGAAFRAWVDAGDSTKKPAPVETALAHIIGRIREFAN